MGQFLSKFSIFIKRRWHWQAVKAGWTLPSNYVEIIERLDNVECIKLCLFLLWRDFHFSGPFKSKYLGGKCLFIPPLLCQVPYFFLNWFQFFQIHYPPQPYLWNYLLLCKMIVSGTELHNYPSKMAENAIVISLSLITIAITNQVKQSFQGKLISSKKI